jgi:hypothetical protein
LLVNEIIQMLSEKIDKKISETLFYRLKKEAIAKRGKSGGVASIFEYLNSCVKKVVYSSVN